MRTSESIAELSPALVAASGELKNPAKSGTARIPGKNGKPGYEYRYSKLEEIVTDVRAVLAKHGLAALQEAVTDEHGHVGITTRLQHRSGEWIEMGPLYLPAGSTAQDAGGSLTYARRYALSAALLLAADADTDGQQQRTPNRAATDPVELVKERKAAADAMPEDEVERLRLLTRAKELFGSQKAVVDAYREEFHPTGTVAVKSITAEQLKALITTMEALRAESG